MIADGVVLIVMNYIDRGIKSEQKLREMEAAQEAKQKHETDKAATRAQKGAMLNFQKHNKHTKGPNNNAKHHNIQQPSKRD